MKSLILAVALLSAHLIFAQSADDIVGVWTTEGGKSHVKIVDRGGKYYGEIIWLKEPTDEAGKTKVDKENPNEALRNRPIVGLEILKGFVFDEDEWEDGTIYDPEKGETYSCEITMPHKNALDVRGYIGISLIGRTTTWTRHTD